MNFTIIINTPKTKKEGISIIVNQNDKISTVKEKYYTKANSRENNQWCFNGAVLKDDKTIDECEIEDMDIIEAHPSSRRESNFKW